MFFLCVCVCDLLRCQTNSVCDGQFVLVLKTTEGCSHFDKHLGKCWLSSAAFTVGMKFNGSVFKCIIYTVQACPGFKLLLRICAHRGAFSRPAQSA